MFINDAWTNPSKYFMHVQKFLEYVLKNYILFQIKHLQELCNLGTLQLKKYYYSHKRSLSHKSPKPLTKACKNVKSHVTNACPLKDIYWHVNQAFTHNMMMGEWCATGRMRILGFTHQQRWIAPSFPWRAGGVPLTNLHSLFGPPSHKLMKQKKRKLFCELKHTPLINWAVDKSGNKAEFKYEK